LPLDQQFASASLTSRHSLHSPVIEVRRLQLSGHLVVAFARHLLPQSIDLEVDLTKSPRVLTVLGLEFNFDKLDKGFQELLLKYGYSSNKKYLNRRSNEEKNENN